jgi:Arc/MetJ-type ribon-helix-helix transcriptional regulator
MAGTKKAEQGMTARQPVVAMTQEMYDWIEERAYKTKKSRADVVREAIELLMKQEQAS